MINFICVFGFVGVFCLALVAADLIFTLELYIVYKFTGGTLGIIRYFKRMI